MKLLRLGVPHHGYKSVLGAEWKRRCHCNPVTCPLWKTRSFVSTAPAGLRAPGLRGSLSASVHRREMVAAVLPCVKASRLVQVSSDAGLRVAELTSQAATRIRPQPSTDSPSRAGHWGDPRRSPRCKAALKETFFCKTAPKCPKPVFKSVVETQTDPLSACPQRECA